VSRDSHVSMSRDVTQENRQEQSRVDKTTDKVGSRTRLICHCPVLKKNTVLDSCCLLLRISQFFLVSEYCLKVFTSENGSVEMVVPSATLYRHFGPSARFADE